MRILENAAADFGFKWKTTRQIKAQIIDELTEIDTHLNDQDKNKLQEERSRKHIGFIFCIEKVGILFKSANYD